MCIAATVGKGGKNDRDDVRTVQLLLNLNAPQIVGPMVADGHCGPETVAAIEQFQRGVIGGKDAARLITPDTADLAPKTTPETIPDTAPATLINTTAHPPDRGRANASPRPAGTTLRALRTGMALGFTSDLLQGIFIHAGALRVTNFFPPILAGMALANIDTPLRRAHFLAQVGHECGELRYTEELSSGAAYEGRTSLGNTQKGDGPRFKGRGLIQITGRTNYTAYGKARNTDFLDGDAPGRIALEPPLAVDAAVWFWQTHNLNQFADKDDVLAITKRVNGGTNGLDDRKRLLARAKWFLQPTHIDGQTISLIHAMQAVGDTA